MNNENNRNFDNAEDTTQDVVGEISVGGDHTELPDNHYNVRSHSDHSSGHSSHGHHSHGHSSHGHHHSRHSSSKHRSSKRSNRNSSKEKFSEFIARNKKYLMYAVLALAAITCLVLLGRILDRTSSSSGNEQTGADKTTINQTTNQIEIALPFFKDDAVIVNPAVKAFMDADSTTKASKIFSSYSGLYSRMDVGLPVTLSYDLQGAPDGINVESAVYIVSETPEMTAPFIFTADRYKNSVDVYNLKTDTRYYYTIKLTFSNGAETSVSGSFKTASGPRLLTVDGVYNLRDIGGWTTSDGLVIKQGLLYRGCEIDGAVEEKYTITPEGVNTMLTVLGIKTDMDLRQPTDNKYGTDALGPGVKHIYYSAQMYSSVFDNPAEIRQVFSDLADESNYPVYLHCTYGTDRTGTVCYLLGAILGMSEADLLKEYQLSAFHHGDVAMDNMYQFIGRINGLPGANVNERIEGWLLSIGVTAEEIESIRSIFLDSDN